ncbi:hypothetical protein BJ508DRAFT_417713 [Ascobolus immersus RN42]|uniref:Uncharacterized protein n=1 Tax=Ascobolus immersus RN42 TaxID=1160509 RepID=A0A3N4HWI3_ASCIM|nr:hypothetical protein BJ508DRAFT_417713 [Ascobolus immersus RN42]
MSQVYSGSFISTITKDSSPATNTASTTRTTLPTNDPKHWKNQPPTRTTPLDTPLTPYNEFRSAITPFSGPDECYTDFGHIMTFTAAPTQNVIPSIFFCFPRSYTYFPFATAAIEHNYYSPAVCPKGYTTDASKITTSVPRSTHWLTATAKDPMETRAVCCPNSNGKWKWDLESAACVRVEAKETMFAAPVNIRWRSDDKLKWKFDKSRKEMAKLSGGEIAGVVIGFVAILLAMGGLVYHARMKRRRKRAGMVGKVELVERPGGYPDGPPPAYEPLSDRAMDHGDYRGDEISSRHEGSSLVADGMRHERGGTSSAV